MTMGGVIFQIHIYKLKINYIPCSYIVNTVFFLDYDSLKIDHCYVVILS